MTLEWTHRARVRLHDLPHRTQTRIVAGLARFVTWGQAKPRHVRGHAGFYELDIADVRIVFRYSGAAIVVELLEPSLR